MKPVITDKEFEVNYHEIDYKKRALFTNIMYYFEDVSMYQSEKLGVGFKYLKENNLAWVLHSWDIEVNRYPIFGEHIIARTMPVCSRKFYADRRFEIIDKNNNAIVVGNSIWLLIDTLKKRPIKITSELREIYGLEEFKGKIRKTDKIELPDSFKYEKGFNVRYSDIDTNLHVNNVKYVSWIIETIPLEIVLNYSLSKLNIIYEKEVKYGGNVKVYAELEKEDVDKITFIHKLEDDERKRVTIAKSVWIK